MLSLHFFRLQCLRPLSPKLCTPVFSRRSAPNIQYSLQYVRLKTTSSAQSKPATIVSAQPKPAIQPAKKYAYPERLLIYHAGTGRTVFVGCLKITTIFVFAFFALVVAPAHFYAPDEPSWIAPVVLFTGVIPFLFVARASAPFVTYIHLLLPPFARNSRELLHRYSLALPPTANLDITTMNLIGRPRVTRMSVAELFKLEKERLVGGANYIRVKGKSGEKRKWWMGREVKEFAVRGGGGGIREKGVWENVAKAIERHGKV